MTYLLHSLVCCVQGALWGATVGTVRAVGNGTSIDGNTASREGGVVWAGGALWEIEVSDGARVFNNTAENGHGACPVWGWS